jgi:XTP/dITP diphosphohydrolase
LDAGPGAAAGNAPDSDNNAKLLRLLRDVPWEQRGARFQCVLAAVRIKPRPPVLAGQTFSGVCEGRIQEAPKGKGGFGYDPLFIPTGHAASFAELDAATKNQLSHRAQALARLRQYFQTLGL